MTAPTSWLLYWGEKMSFRKDNAEQNIAAYVHTHTDIT